MPEKYDVLASQQGIKHTIKGDKAYTDSILDGAQMTTLLKAYYIKYGEKKFIKHLISSFAQIFGGIAFNDSKGRLSTLLKR